MAEIVLTAQTPFRLTVEGTVDTAGSGEVIANLVAAAPGAALLAENNLDDLDSAATARTNLGGTATGVALFTAANAAAAATAVGATVTGAALLTAASATAARTTLSTNVEYFQAQLNPDGLAPGAAYINVPADVSGTVTAISAITNADPGANLAITPGIGPSGGAFVAITDGGITIPNTTAAGTKVSSTPSALNTVVGGTSIIQIAWDDNAPNAPVIDVMVSITRT